VICTCHMGCGYGLDTTRPRTCPVHGWDDDAVFEAVRLAGIGLRDLAGWRERALAAEARVRNLEEAVGELVALMPHERVVATRPLSVVQPAGVGRPGLRTRPNQEDMP
jgi:hypothetical protein